MITVMMMMMMMIIIIIVMVIMMINNDDNNYNVNDDNGDQTITVFETMLFREPVISAKLKFLALNHVLVYGYWFCQVTILSAYIASVMFLLRYYSLFPYHNVISF